MSQVYFSPAARSDLFEIHDYIAIDNEAAADELLTEIHETCSNLAKNPRIGQSRDDLLPGKRLIVVRRMYVAFYRIMDHDIEVIRIVHGRRDFSKLFDL